MNEIAQEVLKIATVARTRKPIVRNLDDPPSITKQTHWPVRILAELAEGRGVFQSRTGGHADWTLAGGPEVEAHEFDHGFQARGRQCRRGQGIPIPIAMRQADEHFEDPRVFCHLGRMWLSCCNFMWGPVWTGAHQVLCEISNDWKMIRRYDVVYGGNGNHVAGNNRWEKNWLWFFHAGAPHMVYTTHPHLVVQFSPRSSTPCSSS